MFCASYATQPSHSVEGLRIGGLQRLIVSSHLAYREADVPDVVPPNAKLTFDLELIAIE